MIKPIKNWLGALPKKLRARGQNQKNNLLWFLSGAGLFFSGAALIVFAEQAMPPSVKQELIATAGLLLLITGGVGALIGYLGMSLFRLIAFFTDKD